MTYNLPPEYRLFLEKIVDEAHGAKLDSTLRENMITDLNGRLQNHLLASFLQAFPNEKTDELEKFMDANPAQPEIAEFFKNNISNLNEVTASAMLEFRTIYLGASAKT